MRRPRGVPRTREAPPRFDAVARAVQRLAVLLEAGLTPVSAWRQLPRGDGSTVVDAVVEGLESAHDIPDRVAGAIESAPETERSAWRAVAAAWSVAAEAGAPLGPTLGRLAEVLRSLAQSARDLEVALAGPVATSRVVLGLPVVGLGLGLVLGFDVIGALATGPGLVCLILGGVLVALGLRWNRRLIRRARTVDATPGLGLELLAVALGGGASLDRARQLVDTGHIEAGLPPMGDEADAVVQFARAAGVPVAALLRGEAEELRRSARSAAARQAAELESRLLLPLGLCILPAFVLLGVAPIAIAIVSSTAVGL